MKETTITFENALSNPKWELITTKYEDETFKVFREVGMKEKETLYIRVHEGWTGVFINEFQFLRTINSWEQLNFFIKVLTENISDLIANDQ